MLRDMRTTVRLDPGLLDRAARPPKNGAKRSPGMAPQVLSAVIRLSTHPRVFVHPSRLDEALAFSRVLIDQPNCVTVQPGPALGHLREPVRAGRHDRQSGARRLVRRDGDRIRLRVDHDRS